MKIDIGDLDIVSIKNGYYFNNNTKQFICIICGETYNIGEIYKFEEHYYDACYSVKKHVSIEHYDLFNDLILDNKYISLTQNQTELLNLINTGMSDNDIATKLDISPSTVRHQKFMFREKAKQAKMYLAVYELATENKKTIKNNIVPIHKGAKMVDDRYTITEEESNKIILSAFASLNPLKLKALSPKEKKKIVILRKISEQFEKEKNYTEKEINQILKDIYDDYATLRRYLIEYGFMQRTSDCNKYWLKQ